jgi:predicted Co/Zn/Cd cation transporter (cation efflux family)
LMPWLTVSLRGERLLVAAAWRDDADFFRPRFKGRLHVDGEIVRIEGALAPNAAAWIILAMLLALAAALLTAGDDIGWLQSAAMTLLAVAVYTSGWWASRKLNRRRRAQIAFALGLLAAGPPTLAK